MRTLVLSTVALAGVLGACSSGAPSGGSADLGPPAGCARSLCDLDYDACRERAEYNEPCQQCRTDCALLPSQYSVECSGACSRVCAQPPADCSSSRAACRATQTNATCIDGIATRDLPAGRPVGYWPRWKPPSYGKRECTPQQVKQLVRSCLLEGATAEACDAERWRAYACHACTFTHAIDGTWGPIIFVGMDTAWTNDWGCVSLVEGDTSFTSCGAKLYTRDACLSRCSNASDKAVCERILRAHTCRREIEAADACTAALGVGTGAPVDVCAVGRADEAALTSLITYFCAR